jgi:DNA (cytosine-5)-methyltransferase 1
MSNPCAWSLTDLESVPQNGLKVMSTFSCGGGSSMGYKLAGCTLVGANDIDPEMQAAYTLNLHPASYYLCPIGDLLKQDLPDELFHLDILDGSPPCSTFSMSGDREKDWGKKKHFREGQTEQVLSDLFFDYLDLVERLRPRVAIAENVAGLLRGNAKGYVRLIVDRFRTIGYKVQCFLIDAADCGVPQHRERTFFTALRDDIEKPKLILQPKMPWVSAAEACADLQQLTAEEIEQTRPAPSAIRLWPYLGKGCDFFSAHEVLGERPTQFNQSRLDGDKPSCTITSCVTQNQYHWNECRKLTMRELIRLGSFPDNYQFRSRSRAGYLIGMSVPPRMMQFVAGEVTRQWLT